MIQGGNWRNLLEQDARDNAALVDVSREPRDTHGVQFKMHCSETIPTNNDVVLFFPNSTKNTHHGGTIIDARKYSAYPALDRSIDEALKATTLRPSRDVSLPHRGICVGSADAKRLECNEYLGVLRFISLVSHVLFLDSSVLLLAKT